MAEEGVLRLRQALNVVLKAENVNCSIGGGCIQSKAIGMRSRSHPDALCNRSDEYHFTQCRV